MEFEGTPSAPAPAAQRPQVYTNRNLYTLPCTIVEKVIVGAKISQTGESPDVFKEGDEGWPLRSLEDDYTSSAWEIYTWIVLIGLYFISLVHNF
tara:strand:+ start:2980 stop:3261 length:282 start_codon:yes stop_codon:yes gene_type:complete